MRQGKSLLVEIILLLTLIVLIVSIILLACVPPVSKDALVHHLAVPKLYLEHGGIYELSHMPYSYYPMNLDLLYMIPLYFGNDIIPKFIHFIFALLTAWLIFDYLRRRLNRTYALFGAAFFLSLLVLCLKNGSGFFTVYLLDATRTYPFCLSQSLSVFSCCLVSFKRPGGSSYYRR